MSHDLRTFIALLEQERQLSIVKAQVNPELEIAAITDRVCKQPDGGNALLFQQTKGYHFPVATNLFGSCKRTALALGVKNLAQLTDKTTDLLAMISTNDPNKLDIDISALAKFNRFTPVTSEAYWKRSTTNLYSFPFLQNWDADGSKSNNPHYITMGQVFTTLPDGSSPNCGMYRAQIIGSDKLAIRWKDGSGAGLHLTQHHKCNKNMPVAITLGGDPALIFSSMMPLPGNLDEVTFAGFLRNYPLRVSPCLTVPLHVPASAEIVIEGLVDPSKSFDEGPFGNHTGYYAPTGSAVIMEITSINIRPNAIIPATIVGPPPMEDCWMFKAWERIILAFLQKLRPEIADIYIPLEWSFHQSAIISLESTHAGMVREISSFLWGLPWFANSRLLIFVSSRIPVDHTGTVSWKAINELDISRTMIMNTNRNSIAIDATGMEPTRPVLQRSAAIESLVSNRWQEYGLA